MMPKSKVCGGAVTYVSPPERPKEPYRWTYHCERPLDHKGAHSCGPMTWTDPWSLTSRSTSP